MRLNSIYEANNVWPGHVFAQTGLQIAEIPKDYEIGVLTQ